MHSNSRADSQRGATLKCTWHVPDVVLTDDDDIFSQPQNFTRHAHENVCDTCIHHAFLLAIEALSSLVCAKERT